jgi:hypothetical protein
VFLRWNFIFIHHVPRFLLLAFCLPHITNLLQAEEVDLVQGLGWASFDTQRFVGEIFGKKK